MRIECENCSATYTIDDGQLSDAPIGAQCPYCGHVKLVQKGGAAASTFSAPALSSGGPQGYPLSQRNTGGAPGFGLLGNSGDMINPGTPDIGAVGGQAAPGFANASTLSGPLSLGSGTGLTINPPGGGQLGGSAQLGAPSPQSFGAPNTGDTKRFGSLDLSISDDFPAGFGATRSNDLGIPGQGPTASLTPGACQVCGTPLNDEFDKVIGLCDLHQRDRRYGEGDDGLASPAPAAASGMGAQWHARSPDGLVSGPMTLEELRVRIRDGSFAATDDFSRDGVDFGPIARFKELAYLASLTAEGHPGRPSGPTFAHRSQSINPWRFVTPVLVLMIVAGVGYLAYQQRGQLARLVAGLTEGVVTSQPIGPNPLQRYKTRWALDQPDVSGTAAEHLVTAKARHLEDTWPGYREAEAAYQRALLVDDEDPAATAGFAENLVLWRFEITAPEDLRVAERAALYATRVEPQDATGHRALGALAYQRRDLNGCRAGADAALQRDATDGRAKLLLAECYLEGNVALAIREAERARQLLPELRRTDMVLGRAYAKQGRFASAFQILSERLKVDPKNAAVHRLYGEVAREVGELSEARRHFKRALQLGGGYAG